MVSNTFCLEGVLVRADRCLLSLVLLPSHLFPDCEIVQNVCIQKKKKKKNQKQQTLVSKEIKPKKAKSTADKGADREDCEKDINTPGLHGETTIRK